MKLPSLLLTFFVLAFAFTQASRQKRSRKLPTHETRNEAASLDPRKATKSLIVNPPGLASMFTSIEASAPRHLSERRSPEIFGHILGRKFLKSQKLIFGILVMFNFAREEVDPRISPTHVYVALFESLLNFYMDPIAKRRLESAPQMFVEVLTRFENFLLHAALCYFDTFNQGFLSFFAIALLDVIFYWAISHI